MAVKKLTVGQQIFYLTFSVLINALGNAFTVILNLGSALWTAAAVNLIYVIPISLTLVLVMKNVFGIIANICMLREVDLRRIAGNLLFMLPFSYLVGFFTTLLRPVHLTHLPLIAQIILDLFGVVLIGVAISIYQRVNLILHPLDDMMQIMRFKYLRGNAVKAQLAAYTPPIIVIVVLVLLTHQIHAVNIGTIFALLFQGTIVGYADVWIFPSLKHQRLNSINQQSR